MARGEILLLLQQADLKQKCRLVYISRGKTFPGPHSYKRRFHSVLVPGVTVSPPTTHGKGHLQNQTHPGRQQPDAVDPEYPHTLCRGKAVCIRQEQGHNHFCHFQGPSSKQHRHSLWIWGEKSSRSQIWGFHHHQQEGSSFSKEMKFLFHLYREQRGTGVGLDGTANSEDADVGKTRQQNQRESKCWDPAEECVFSALSSLCIEMTDGFVSRLGSGHIFDSQKAI